MIEKKAIEYLKRERVFAEEANKRHDVVAKVKHQTRYENVYEFLQEVDLLPKFWNVRNPNQRP